MKKEILFGDDARLSLFAGIRKVADAVCVTLGPMGRCAIISRCFPSQTGMQYYMPFATKDGVTVARNITLDNQLENTGANLIKQAAEKTMQDCGDGTTTTVLLMRHIVERGLQLVAAGYNPQEIKKGIDQAVMFVVSNLKKMSIPVGNDIEKIRQVATVSANNDSAIGNLIAEAFEKIGVDGIIDIEEAKGTTTEIKTSDGIKFNRGWESQYFITNKAKNESELSEPYILLYDKKITNLNQLPKAVLETIGSSASSLLIVCDNVDGEALAALAMNAQNGSFKSCVVRCPEFGDLKRQSMEDLAAITGATYISDEKGKALKNATMKDLGRAKKAVVSKDNTIIIAPENNKTELENLLNNLKMDLAKAEGEDKDSIEKRIAKLTGGVAILYVGAPTEVEMKEKKDRVDDAVRATKAAIAEGYTIGSGAAFLRVKGEFTASNESFAKGMILIGDILQEPILQICKNAGVNGVEILNKLSVMNGYNGYNAKSGNIEDLVKSGIIDPVKVLRCSLENAASAAGMVLTSETLICDTV